VAGTVGRATDATRANGADAFGPSCDRVPEDRARCVLRSLSGEGVEIDLVMKVASLHADLFGVSTESLEGSELVGEGPWCITCTAACSGREYGTSSSDGSSAELAELERAAAMSSEVTFVRGHPAPSTET
jgi:hypothetical protein